MALWPRGVKKEKVDVWLKELGTPKDLIKKWKGGKVTWAQFSSEYRRSLRGKEALLESLRRDSASGTVTLLCTEKEGEKCHRHLLKEAIERSG